jgi:hypothetical protein
MSTPPFPFADHAPTGRAKCVHCGEGIAKGSVRIAVEREIKTSAFDGKGAAYLHAACCEAWASAAWPAGFDDLRAQVQRSAQVPLPAPFDVVSDPSRASMDATSAVSRATFDVATRPAPSSDPIVRDLGVFSVARDAPAPLLLGDAFEAGALIFSQRIYGGVHPPRSIPRFSVDEVASALGISLEAARAQLDALLVAHPAADAVTKRLVRAARLHADGTFSYSYAPSTYESQRFPDAHQIEAMVARGAFAELDAALSAARAKAPSWASVAPVLAWADGTQVSPGARAWFLAPIGAKTTYSQVEPRDAGKPVRGAHDLLRFAFDDASMGAFARWVIETPIKNGPRAFPLAPAAIEAAAVALHARSRKGGRTLPPFVIGDLTCDVVGRRLLLAAGLIGPIKHDLLCHDAWPRAPEGAAAQAWSEIAERFLDAATANGLRISCRTLAAHYLSRPWLAALVRARRWASDAKPVDLAELPTSDRLVHLMDGRAPDDGPAPELGAIVMHVKEWSARCARAGMMQDCDYTTAPYAFKVDPLGTFTVTPTGYGAGWGGHDKDIRIVSFEAEQRGVARWRCNEKENVGWEKLDPTWRALIRERIRVLVG